MAQDRPPLFDQIKKAQRRIKDTADDRARALHALRQTQDGRTVAALLREIADEPVFTAERDAVAMAFQDGRRSLALMLLRNGMEGSSHE